MNHKQDHLRKGQAFLRANWPWWLVLSFVALLPTKNLVHIPVGIMAIIGLLMLVRRSPTLPDRRALRLLFTIFGCIWIPMLLSLPGATDLEHSAVTTLSFLRFPLMGVFILAALKESRERSYLRSGVLCVLLFWCIDALWQLIWGTNLFGYPLQSHRLTGIFYPRYRLGIVLAAFLPLYLEVVRHLVRRTWLASLLVPPIIVVIVLSGSRAGWLMLALGLVLYGIFLARATGLRALVSGRAMLIGAVLILTTSVFINNFPIVTDRASEVMNLFSSDLHVIDDATKKRLSIWRPGLEIARTYWLNGIGVRGFRYQFLKSADSDNFWMLLDPQGVTHPHMHAIEVMIETGLIGVIGYVAFFVLIIRLTRGQRAGPGWLTPLVICVLVAMFPLNVHKALYASFWISICWWLVFVALATYESQKPINAGCSTFRRDRHKRL